MLSVLLVDDDYLVRMYLRQLIDWEQEGFCLVGDACNGEEALRLMEQTPVHLLITDLGMPVVDGISLIRRIRDTGSVTRTAVLSCHDEFEYVKEAMRLGADEYILKNDLNAASLRKLLAAMKEKIAKTQAQADEQQELWMLAQRGSEQLKQEAFERLFAREHPYEEQARILQQGTWKGTYYCAGAIAVNLAGQPQESTILQVCRQLLREGDWAFFVQEGRAAFAIADLSGLVLRSEQTRHLQRLAAQMADAMEQYAGVSPCVGVSRLYEADGSVTKALQEAAALLPYGFYGRRLVTGGSVPPLARQMPGAALALPARLRETPPDPPFCEREFGALLDALEAAPVHPDAVRQWILELDALLAPQGAPPPQTLAACRKRAALYRESQNRPHPRQEAIHAENPAVIQAAQYIRRHFSEPLSLGKTADTVGLNPAYLSHIFKKEMGMGFAEYLQQQRIEYVKQELARSGGAIKDIAAAAGFYDYRHFSKLFKKQTGMSPAQWRRNA